MQIEFKIPKTHVCQDNTCFKPTFVFVKNMTDMVILGNPFMCLLYPFITDSKGITTHPFGQPVKFKFLWSPEPREINSLQEVSVSQTLNLINASNNCNQAQNLDSFVSTTFFSAVDLFGPIQSQNSSQHIHHKNICFVPSHVLNKCIFENSWKILYAFLNMSQQEEKQIIHNISPIGAWKMASSKNKGKAPIQGYSQEKRLPSMGQYFKMHEGASSGVEPRKATSLQEFVPTMVTYSSADTVVTLQEVLSKTLKFTNGVYTDLLPFIKFILDNHQSAYIRQHHNHFQRTLKALEIHLVNLEAGNEALTSQLFSKEDIHSMDRMTIMGTDYARLSLKTQATLRSVVANLPTDIQARILGSKAMFESSDQWFKHFKVLVTTHFPVFGKDSDDVEDVFILTTWEEYFGSSLRIYEKKHPFPSLIVNYEDRINEKDRDPSWLSRMFEYGFIRLIKLTSHNQISQFPQIIQQVATQINSPFVSIRCWSIIPQWDNNN